MVHCLGLAGVIPMMGSRGKPPKAPTILKYLKPENNKFWTVLRQASNPK